jgi:hypothetical protein
MLLSVEKREFLLDIIDVLNAYGTPDDDISLLGYVGNGVVYEDGIVKIITADEHKYCVVTRKSNQSQVIMMERDVVIRFHGEFIYLTEHISNLISKSKEEVNESTK